MKVLAVSAHPDDETLGCGGTLLKHAAAGDEISWVIATEAFEPQWPRAEIAQKADEVAKVASAYRMKDVFRLRFPTTSLDGIPRAEVIEGVRTAVAEARPAVVYLVHGGDVHTDHQALFVATMSVLRPSHMRRFGVQRVLSFEVLSSTEAAPPAGERAFLPTVFSDITTELEQKLAIMALYESEVHADPLPRGTSAIRALARVRGATIGIAYAEAFMLIRELI